MFISLHMKPWESGSNSAITAAANTKFNYSTRFGFHFSISKVVTHSSVQMVKYVASDRVVTPMSTVLNYSWTPVVTNWT